MLNPIKKSEYMPFNAYVLGFPRNSSHQQLDIDLPSNTPSAAMLTLLIQQPTRFSAMNRFGFFAESFLYFLCIEHRFYLIF